MFDLLILIRSDAFHEKGISWPPPHLSWSSFSTFHSNTQKNGEKFHLVVQPWA